MAFVALSRRLLLTGRTLVDQGRVVTVTPEAGWSAERLWQVSAGRPLPEPVRVTVRAIVAARPPAARRPPPVVGAGRPEGPAWDTGMP